jgi:dihydroorotase
VNVTVLRGGRVVDPVSSTDAISDVVITDGVIAAIGPDLARSYPSATVVECAGLLVTPGLIDLHVHVMEGLGNFCVGPDVAGVDRGVPTVVDGGTSGTATFDISRRAIIDHPETRTDVLAFIDPNQLYLATKDFIAHKLHIADDPKNLDLDELAACVERHGDVIVGAKVRACHTGDPTRSPFVEGAQQVLTDRPIMVHLGRFPHTPVIPPATLLRQMRPGDIITHAFRGGGGMVDADGKVVAELRDAVDRGVVLDIGHSGTDFRFRDARRLMDQGVMPDTASTDLNMFNVDGPVFSITENLTKLLALGMTVSDVVATASSNPARVIQRESTLGALAPGRRAEISVMQLLTDGPYPVTDGHEVVESPAAFAPVGCVRAGEWIPVPRRVASYAVDGFTPGHHDPEEEPTDQRQELRSLRRWLVDGAEAPGVDADAGAHRRRDGDLAQVAALGRRRLGALQLVEHRTEVRLEVGGVEAGLAERHVHVAVAVGAVLDLAALELRHGASHVVGDGAGLRVRHQATGAERTTETTDERHHVGRGDGDVEVELAGLDLGGEVIGADDVGTRLTRRRSGLAGGEHGHAHILARARRQGHSAADHLVGLAGVDAEADGDVHALVEPALGDRLDDPHGLGRRVELIAVEALQGVAVLLAGHRCLPRGSDPPGEVVPDRMLVWSCGG